ncbi:MAG: sigma-70 family RNA polymerase sigma factor [Nitrosomonas sp. H1_AOB3]|nr:MAG: sigma-70 family RNA polymerase sigma factor [Nitrosomonas sp. H1_AOB3]
MCADCFRFYFSKAISMQESSAADTGTAVIDALYREHHRWLLMWLRKKLGCPQNAADLSHDTFVRLLSLQEMPVLREPRAYLLVTANRLMINLNRKHKVEAETLHSIAALLSERTEQDVAHVAAVRQLLEATVLMLIDGLDERSRQAFLLARVEDMTYAEIAETMQVSVSRVKQYLVKALAYCHVHLHQLKEDVCLK